MRHSARIAFWIALSFLVGANGPAFADSRVLSLHEQRPLAFEANRGQTDSRVKFLTQGTGYTFFLTPSEAVLSLRDGSETRTVRLAWTGGNPVADVLGGEKLAAKSHYLLGKDPAGWRRNVPIHSRVLYDEIYPGIDLVFYGRLGMLEHDYIVAPGADPRAIRLRIEGADSLAIDPSGDLVIRLGDSEIRLLAPVSYQETDGVRREVPSRFRIDPAGRVGFAVAAYDRAAPLVIDPVLAYSTYLGGTLDEGLADLAIDHESGGVCVTGWTSSPDFPELHALPTPSTEPPARGNVIISCFDEDGTLTFSTYLGGEGGDEGLGLDVSGGGIAVVGRTLSADFPQVNDTLPKNGTNYYFGFVSLLDPSGSQLLWSALIGGEGHNDAWDTAMAGGFVYVTGWTDACDFPYYNGLPAPVSCEPFSFYPQAFVMKISLDGQEVPWSSSLGGRGFDKAHRIAVDAQGSAVVAGGGLVAKLSASGSSLVYSVPLGETFGGVAVDAPGNAFVAGTTSRDDFPTVRPLQPARAGSSDAFVAKLTPTGALDFSTYLGGSGEDFGNGIDVDARGAIYVSGETRSPDFPVLRPVQAACASACDDAFLAKIAPSGTALVYSTFLGGSGRDAATAVGVDSQGGAWIAGNTTSPDFPIAGGAFPELRGDSDGFLARIADANQPPVCSAAVAVPSTLWPPNGKMAPVAIRGITDPDGEPVTITITNVLQDEPVTGGDPDAAGLGSSTTQVRAARSGKGDGRVYHILFQVRDPGGAACVGEVTVCVPHDRRRTCGDGGAPFASTK